MLANSPSQLLQIPAVYPACFLMAVLVDVEWRPGLGRPRTSQRLYRVMIHM